MEKINFWAAAVSAIVYFVLGGLWYSPVLFSKRWVKELGIVIDPEKRPNVVAPMLGQLVSSFFYTAGMVFIISTTGCKSIYHPLIVSLVVIFGFIIPLNTGTLLFKAKPVLFLIEAGYQAIGTIIISLILGFWK